MNEEIKWRFKGNNYTTEFGLDTSDMETFKKRPNSFSSKRIMSKLNRCKGRRRRQSKNRISII